MKTDQASETRPLIQRINDLLCSCNASGVSAIQLYKVIEPDITAATSSQRAAEYRLTNLKFRAEAEWRAVVVERDTALQQARESEARVNELEGALREYFKEAHDALKEDAVCDHSVGICWCPYIRAVEKVTTVLAQPAPVAASDCVITGGSSRMCERGTKSCEVRHKTSVADSGVEEVEEFLQKVVKEHEQEAKANAGRLGLPQGPCQCHVCARYRKKPTTVPAKPEVPA